MALTSELGKAIVSEFSPEFRNNNKFEDINEEVYDMVASEFVNNKYLFNNFIDWYYGKIEMYNEETLTRGVEIVNNTFRLLNYILSDERKWVKREFACPVCKSDLRNDNSIIRETYFEDRLRLKDNRLYREKDHEIKHDNLLCSNCGTILNDFVQKFQYGNLEIFKDKL